MFPCISILSDPFLEQGRIEDGNVPIFVYIGNSELDAIGLAGIFNRFIVNIAGLFCQ